MFPTLFQLFYSPWGYGVSLPGSGDGMSFEVGIIGWMIILWGSVMAGKNGNKLIRYLVISVFLAGFFILPISLPIYSLGLSHIIDFPWRLLMCVVFGAAWMGAEILDHLTIKTLKHWMAGLITLTLIAYSLPIAHTDKYWDKPMSWFARETGDSYGEYAPRTRETRDSSPFWKRAEFVEGTGTIETKSDKSNEKIFRIVSEREGSVRINTAYFPGWVIPQNCFVTKRTLTHIDDSGLIGCTVPMGETILKIRYESPPVQRVGNLITLVGIGIYLWILCQSYCLRSTKKMR